jgi:membrane-bound lytic murein transglycosylase F
VQQDNVEGTKSHATNELRRILSEKELKVVVDYNSTNYFVYKGSPMGFQYELLKAFCNEKGLDLKISVNNNLEQSIEGLIEGEYDLIARNMTVTAERNREMEFAESWGLTRQVLVQRKPVKEASSGSGAKNYITEQIQLGGQTVVVPEKSVYSQRLRSLSNEIGNPIIVVEDSLNGPEQLIAKVASGEIDYTVCDENIGRVLSRFYPSVDISIPISFNQKYAWAIKKDAPNWKSYLNEWIKEFKKTSHYRIIYNKYFSDFSYQAFALNAYNTISGEQISDFDEIIKEIASYYQWDWRLIASVVMQESGFNADAESWMGAAGLMQLMPGTAEMYNVDDVKEPRENIRGGIEYLSWIDEIFQPLVPDRDERLKFVLASYNVGIGHVMDARKLAMKYNHDPSVWEGNVEFFVLNKSLPKYYSDPIVRWGYCRGEEPVNYVNKIIDRYQHYRNTLPGEPDVALAAN